MNRRDVSFHDDEEEYIEMEVCSSPENREFEFQMSISCNDTETFTSPADDLFCNGKLLPLHHLSTTAATAAAATTPLDSCCLSPDDHFIEWSNELNAFIINKTTSTWINKMKNSILGMKLRAYLKSLFNTSSRNFQKAPDKINVVKRSEEGVQRRSFSGGSSSSSSSSSSFGDRRSSSAAEVEGSIEAAIAHCKKSHHI